MKDEVLLAALAGLLHDVGHSQKGISDFLPPRWQEALGQIPEALAPLASQLSAGESKPEGQTEAQPGKPGQLQSIFCTVAAKGKRTPDKKYLPLGALKLNRQTIFPDEPLPDNAVQEQYKTLWDDFAEEAKALKAAYETTGGMESYIESMLALLHRFGWCIPAARHSALADVSLYDHSRMTAALAAVLAEVDEDRLQAIAKDPGSSRDEVALLVGGDISGVQDFIYTISSKGAAKTLRGRSFYLQLLTEAALRFVLNRLELPYTNVIYSGGGHFYLLAPLSAKDELPKIQAVVGKILLQQHGAQLYLAMSWVSVPAGGFQAKQLSEHWQKMQNDLTIAKNRRYRELGADLYQEVFTLPKYGGNPDETCSVCGDDRRGAENWDEWEGQSKICPLCRSFAEDLGKDLPSARFLALKFGEARVSNGPVKGALDILRLFDMDVQFIKNGNEKVAAQSGQYVVIWALDDPAQDKDKKEQWPATSQLAPRWLRYTVNRVPMVNDREEAEKINSRLGNVDGEEKTHIGQPMTFTHLSALSENDFRRLGVLRMDVDNLGLVFKDGLGELFSLSRMATLSSQISMFFEGWLKRIVDMEGWNNRVYAVYSGGDDLFLLAPWEKVPPLALKIVDDFAAYTDQHPALHISGGMAFIGGKYPIYQAAEDAAEAEGLAKQDGKNAFAFLNKRWVWTDFRELEERKDILKNLVVAGEAESEHGGPKSILQVLRSLAKMEEEATETKSRPVWGRWMWLGAYQLARMEKQYETNATLREKIAEMHKQLGDFQHTITWGAAARWAQLETRKKKKDE